MVVDMRFIRAYIAVVVGVVLVAGGAARAEPFVQALRFVFTEATSQTLLKSGQIDFSAAITLGPEVEPVRLDFDTALEPPRDGTPRYAIVMDVFRAKSDRRVIDLASVPSTVFLGFQGSILSVPTDDPARQAQGFDQAMGDTERQAPYAFAPQPLGQPTVLSYAYQLAKVQARRNLSARIYLIDRMKQTYIRTVVDVSEEQRFEIPYRLSYRDPRKNAIRAEYSSEDELDDYEKLELLIDLNDLLADFESKAGDAKPFASALALRRMIRAEQNQNLATLEANRFDARPLNDPRFDSVVAIYTGPGTMGSGFYVAPNVVMTNWHVVDGRRFVEMKGYDGLQTFGTVLGYDARLDIALVQAERRGRPVSFYTGRTLNPGAQVEAIGHPYRHEFSITRGVISAVRRHASINLPKKSAGEDVLFVQTDTPINPGNSGGPLFQGQRVVGMNTWGSNTDGLSFSVHYSELLNFINEHLPGFHVNPAGGD